MSELLEKRRALRQAVADLTHLKLHEAARWASTQLLGTRKPDAATEDARVVRVQFGTVDEHDAYDFASCSFDAREYSTAVHTLEPYRKASTSSKFLYYYSRYLKLQKLVANKQRNAKQTSSLLAGTGLAELRTELEGEEKDAFLLYVLGMALMDLNNMAGARRALIESVSLYPCNWSAWKALTASSPDIASFREVESQLPKHFMADFFRAHVLVNMQHSEEGLELMDSSLEGDFPESHALISTRAVAHSHMRNYELSNETFQKLLVNNPHTIEGMDVYSNILYVKEDHVELTLLARRLADEDPYRSETCCVIGNFYSFRGAHERAVVYFQRALKLNPNCLAAWTLMVRDFNLVDGSVVLLLGVLSDNDSMLLLFNARLTFTRVA